MKTWMVLITMLIYLAGIMLSLAVGAATAMSMGGTHTTEGSVNYFLGTITIYSALAYPFIAIISVIIIGLASLYSDETLLKRALPVPLIWAIWVASITTVMLLVTGW